MQEGGEKRSKVKVGGRRPETTQRAWIEVGSEAEDPAMKLFEYTSWAGPEITQ